MSSNLSNFTAPDNYGSQPSDVGFLRCQDAVRVRITVSNQSIFWQRGFGAPGGSVGRWEPEEELPPIRASLEERCDFIRIRAATPAASLPPGSRQAQVTLATRTAQELRA